jgi:prolyl-tRNA synthetase
MAQTYSKIFSRCGLNSVRVSADSGAMGGTGSEEFMVPSEIGEETIVVCPKCGYAANVEKAECYESIVKKQIAANPLEKVDTPDVRTIDELSVFFKTTPDVFIKTLVYVDEKNTPYIALIRGDLEVNEVKLQNIIGANEILIADDKVVEKVTGAPIGFAGPINLKNIKIIADNSIKDICSGYTGANEKDKHYKNVFPDRDFKPDLYADIRTDKQGDLCIKCQNKLDAFKGIEVGHIFKLGKKYTTAFNVTYLDENQQTQIPTMGTYGIGVGRTFACAVEQLHDENGIIFPMSIAPYQIIFVPLGKAGDETFQTAEKLYSDCLKQKIEALIDDRDERAGVKFKDADLIGIPIRVTIGKKTLSEGKVELKMRNNDQSENIEIDKLIQKLKDIISGELNKFS